MPSPLWFLFTVFIFNPELAHGSPSTADSVSKITLKSAEILQAEVHKLKVTEGDVRLRGRLGNTTKSSSTTFTITVATTTPQFQNDTPANLTAAAAKPTASTKILKPADPANDSQNEHATSAHAIAVNAKNVAYNKDLKFRLTHSNISNQSSALHEVQSKEEAKALLGRSGIKGEAAAQEEHVKEGKKEEEEEANEEAAKETEEDEEQEDEEEEEEDEEEDEQPDNSRVKQELQPGEEPDDEDAKRLAMRQKLQELLRKKQEARALEAQAEEEDEEDEEDEEWDEEEEEEEEVAEYDEEEEGEDEEEEMEEENIADAPKGPARTPKTHKKQKFIPMPRPVVPQDDDDDDDEDAGFDSLLSSLKATIRSAVPKKKKKVEVTPKEDEIVDHKTGETKSAVAQRTLELLQARRLIEEARMGNGTGRKKRSKNTVDKKCSREFLKQDLKQQFIAEDRNTRYLNNTKLKLKGKDTTVDERTAARTVANSGATIDFTEKIHIPKEERLKLMMQGIQPTHANMTAPPSKEELGLRANLP
eukprot:gnl/MRDRNA2_/MRDRNA2_99614_c0_seq1.p1 gnl/MRDRNA2_/MRDRNA2_99614_c0~~gnl/MRDRNA2_/MRDRNA2_99614_c0_seq1.p1  ORF type:complete len:551 (+),score=191.43 gnl/MRDRNA2_/MRDRNA2_99614_c0_seq1:58-1653(+)